ncbi:MAG: hypothetical protein RR806_02920, partial [Oscillospiraceae bacterium]
MDNKYSVDDILEEIKRKKMARQGIDTTERGTTERKSVVGFTFSEEISRKDVKKEIPSKDDDEENTGKDVEGFNFNEEASKKEVKKVMQPQYFDDVDENYRRNTPNSRPSKSRNYQSDD